MNQNDRFERRVAHIFMERTRDKFRILHKFDLFDNFAIRKLYEMTGDDTKDYSKEEIKAVIREGMENSKKKGE